MQRLKVFIDHHLQGRSDEFWSLLWMLFMSHFPSFSVSHVSLTFFLHLSSLHLFLCCSVPLSSSFPAQIPFVSQSSSLSFYVPISVFISIYFSFSRSSLLPLASPSEGRLQGVIQPPRQLHITSCLRKLHTLSPLPLSASLPPSLSALPQPLLAHLNTQSGRSQMQPVTAVRLWHKLPPFDH